MKYKKLTEEQIIIAFDRLTRFKNTRDKYVRVYTDILIWGLTEPLLKKKEIEKLDFGDLTAIASEIINASLPDTAYNAVINSVLKDYENAVYINDADTQKLLNNRINYAAAGKLIDDSNVVNLRWLKSIICGAKDLRRLREKELLKYPVEEVILAEGITEEILLPAFAKYLGCDFYGKGIHVIAAGGKNQVVKMYYKLSDELKLPMFLLLDSDAEDNIRQIRPKLRPNDRIHLVKCGEFEDLLPKSLIVKTVNSHFKNFLSIKESDIDSTVPAAKYLSELFKTRGLHEFKKAEFAKLVRDNITSDSDISDEIQSIIRELNT